MNRETAHGVFKSQIIARWPDFKLSPAILDDWINLFTKFNPDDICRAASQYVLNYECMMRPSLAKFKEVLNAVSLINRIEKSKEEKWPQYFLQQDDPKAKLFKYGTFTAINVPTVNPDMARTYIETAKERFQSSYGGDWKAIICNNRQDVIVLIEDRTKKCWQQFLEREQNERQKSEESIAENVRKIIDSFSSRKFFKDNDKKDAPKI